IDAELKTVNEEMDVKTATIAQLEQNIKTLTAEKEKLQAELIGYTGEDGQLSAVDNLLNAADIYMKDPTDTSTVAEYLDMIDEMTVDTAGIAFENVYNHLRTQVGTSVGKSYYDTGMEAYQNESYEDAIEYLSRAFSYDNTNGEALYNLGNAYRKFGDDANAIATYQQVIELFPNTEKANRSQSFINEMTAETE
ncbi:MAG: tetratricopeptide repeat protein, partial [Eubacterium sp.]|nr:tetratricopeptide repeat protein [Eubacterium sp.]